MKKENWLAPVSKNDVAGFAHKHMNLERIMVLEENEDLNYGKFFEVGGFTNEPVISSWGKANQYFNPINLGEFGPVDADEYRETTVNDLRQLFGEDQNLINIYLAWIMLVAEKNAGRQIDGKTYLESFSNACHSHIDLVKAAEIRAVENEADEKKKCVSAFVSQIAPKKDTDTVAPQKQ
ncbi:MAG: hypothetical protein IJA23_02825 [Clostridia bacterium]|nr:hypothetical protein [Clostridia bacterium]